MTPFFSLKKGGLVLKGLSLKNQGSKHFHQFLDPRGRTSRNKGEISFVPRETFGKNDVSGQITSNYYIS